MWQVMNHSKLAWSFLWDNTHRGNPLTLKWSVIKWALYFPQMPALFCLVSNHLRTYNCWSQHPSQHLHLGAWVQDSKIPNTAVFIKNAYVFCFFFLTSLLPQWGNVLSARVGIFTLANLFNQHLALSTFLLWFGWLPEAPANGLKRWSRNLQFVSHAHSVLLPAFWSTCSVVWAQEPGFYLLTAALLTTLPLLSFVLHFVLLSIAPALALPRSSR